MTYDVVVLAGGRSSRFGTDKVALLLDGVLGLLPADAVIVCVGPAQGTERTDVRWVREEPPFAGPLAALAVGVSAGEAEVVVVVGADMPLIGSAIPSLVEAATAGNGAVLIDDDGWPQPLASAWRRDVLVERLSMLGALEGQPLRRLLDGASLVPVPDRWGASRDIDSPADLTDLANLTDQERE